MSYSDDLSVVKFYGENEGYRCGYCKSPDTNYSEGMWAHGLSVEDYQDLIDRGWRRSGRYCYKPTMQLTCCPMYTIKCSALEFKPSKSQKKKLKKVHAFLAYGKTKSEKEDEGTNESVSDMESGDDAVPDYGLSDIPDLNEKAEKAQLNMEHAIVSSVDASLQERLSAEESERRIGLSSEMSTPSASNVHNVKEVQDNTNKIEESFKSSGKKLSRTGDGIDPNRPRCKKAKLLRQERKEKKLALLGSSSLVSSQKTKTPPNVKSVEDFINEPLPEIPAHRLEIRLVNVTSPEMTLTFDTSWELFAKYQMVIHKEDPDECDQSTFSNFLVYSPLKSIKPRDGPPQGYGSFHQQYWLDGRLIAVGVIDILPYCVSSVYFFYDPEFHFLTLGTYGSLREIAFCRTLHHSAPSIRYYYMGFYIHSCQKMRYKGAFFPSFLLCPEVYSWHPIETCIPRLDGAKYCRFNEDSEAKDTDQVFNISNVCVLFLNKAMTYKTYRALNQTNKYQEEVTQYAKLVGNKLSRRMLLVLM